MFVTDKKAQRVINHFDLNIFKSSNSITDFNDLFLEIKHLPIILSWFFKPIDT